MSISDKDPPTYQISSQEDRDAIVADVLAHAALQEAHYRQPMTEEATPGRWKGPLAMIVLVLAGILGLFPPAWLAGDWPAPLTDDDHLRGLTATLHIQAEQLDAYRIRHGRLPNSLADLQLPGEDVRYVRSNNRLFQLVATGPDGRNLVYDSTQPAPDFTSVARGWVETPDVP